MQETDPELAPPPRSWLNPRVLVLIIALGALVPLAFAGWRDLYSRFLETARPTVEVIDFPRGVGLTPVTVNFRVKDASSGLSEFVVSIEQRGKSKEILRATFSGDQTFERSIELSSEKSFLEEGSATLNVVARDSALWRNTTNLALPLKIDFRKPKLELVGDTSSVRQGGSGLIFYKALDESLALSGVKAGNKTFFGFPAKGIDKEFEDASLYVCLYSIDLGQSSDSPSLRLFAEDEVGNATSINLPAKVEKRTAHVLSRNLSEEFLRDTVSPVIDLNYERIKEVAKSAGKTIDYKSDRLGPERYVEQFLLYNGILREINDGEIVSKLQGGARYERYWAEFFAKQPGSIVSSFGDRLNFNIDNKKVDDLLLQGYEIALPRSERDVYAINDGFVVFSDNLGVYGRAVAIDHGLGLVSIYGNLSSALVNRGEFVPKNKAIGVIGNSGFSEFGTLIFQLRIQGVPVNAAEWWDSIWYNENISAKIDHVKQIYGIPIYKPLP